MAFTISFQGQRPREPKDQYAKRMKDAEQLEEKIRQAGGTVLRSGLDELFDNAWTESTATSPSTPSGYDPDISLSPAAAEVGFAALIADGHSRKTKYMQALALGLPCIAPRWVTTCLERESLVDWSPYLLCAGESSFLGGAIRSRNLVAYDASTAKLADTIGLRSKLLEGSSILLVMKKSEEETKMPYVFLARVLGASLSRVYSVDDARATLRAMEDLGRPYDWVYVAGKVDRSDIFAEAAPPDTKKRKRSGSHANGGPAPKKIRTLSNELVIQSLILGRLMEDNEMEE